MATLNDFFKEQRQVLEQYFIADVAQLVLEYAKPRWLEVTYQHVWSYLPKELQQQLMAVVHTFSEVELSFLERLFLASRVEGDAVRLNKLMVHPYHYDTDDEKEEQKDEDEYVVPEETFTHAYDLVCPQHYRCAMVRLKVRADGTLLHLQECEEWCYEDRMDQTYVSDMSLSRALREADQWNRYDPEKPVMVELLSNAKKRLADFVTRHALINIPLLAEEPYKLDLWDVIHHLFLALALEQKKQDEQGNAPAELV